MSKSKKRENHRWWPPVKVTYNINEGKYKINHDIQTCLHCDCKRVVGKDGWKEQWRYYIDKNGNRQNRAPECEGNKKRPLWLYRYYDAVRGEHDPDIRLEKFLIIKYTKQGYWFVPEKICFEEDRKPRWTSSNSLRRKAYPTEKEAMVNYMARKKVQIRIYSARLHNAELLLREAQKRHGIPEEKRYSRCR